jgi:hypothetical protein
VSTLETPLVELIFDRLLADGVPAKTADVVLAALAGDDDLASVLIGQPPRLDLQTAAADKPRPHIYLSSVTVAGFRGVGPERTLHIKEGPGLTLVVGRNGSGKSSFAEAVELALTGDSARWADRNSVWRTGWRNLHAPHPCRISVELREDGVAAPLRVTREWPEGGDLRDARVSVSTGDGTATSLADLGLARPLELYRPFLTAAELGKLLSGTPSELFDAINAILGLEALTEADRRLMAAARPYEAAIRDVRAQRETLRADLAEVDDDRARRAASLLTRARPDLDQLDAILAEPLDAGLDSTVELCRRLAALVLPGADEVARLAEDLREAAAEAARHEQSRSRASLRVAEMLRLALEHHDDSGDGPCPVCGTGRLDGEWHADAAAKLNTLRDETLAAKRASSRAADLVRQARLLVGGITLPDGDVPDLPLAALRGAVATLREAPSSADGLAAHLAVSYPEVAKAAEAVREAADNWLRERENGWRQAAARLRVWVDAARRAAESEQQLALLRKARDWLRKAGGRIRDERLAPFAAHSQRVWQQLRQQSSVQLGAMTLAGAANRRRVVFPVRVDGADNGTALGVMSQGEMHALGLATFLPRSCAAESPFRFTVIDDPVQSMDPSKVDGLARVLAELAADRQVVVFTHDSRLPDAVRRLEVDADILEVARAERSVVTLRRAQDPVSRYLDDAWGLARSTGIPADVRAPVVAELCRSALEAACHRVIWRTRLAKGERHADIEAAIESASHRLATTFALALFDDPQRGGDVLARLTSRYGRRAADAYQACKKGVHEVYRKDLTLLVNDTRALAEALSSEALS